MPFYLSFQLKTEYSLQSLKSTRFNVDSSIALRLRRISRLRSIDKVLHDMKYSLFAVLAILAILGLPGCCCTPAICMPTMCHNPYWMEDLQDDYCQLSSAMQAKFCRFQQQARCRMAQLNASLTCPCQQCAMSRQHAYPCSNCQGFQSGNTMQYPAGFPANQPQMNQMNQSFTEPGFSTQNYPPASINSTQEPAPAPPASVPGPPVTLPATPDQHQPAPNTAPVPVPKINPSASNQPPAMILTDPSIPLEFQTNLNQVGFRKAETDKPKFTGWRPAATVPEALR
jgi:hypothetical protein